MALIFIIEDERHVRDMIKNALAALHHVTVKAFGSVAEVLKAPDLATVDLFIIDIQLGEKMTGFEVPAVLPARCRFAGYLFMSGYDLNRELYDRAAGLSLFDFIAKPFSLAELRRRVELLLSARQRLPSDVDDRLIWVWSRDLFLAVVIDDQLIIRLANERLAHLVGKNKPRDLVGLSWLSFIPEDHAQRLKSVYAAILDRQGNPLGENQSAIMGAGGHVHEITWFNSTTEGDQGQQLIISVGIPSEHQGRNSIKQLYREILIKDRTAIRKIKPLSVPAADACQFEGGKA